MGRNTLGKLLQITSFGESHGPYTGVVIDGFPSNFGIDTAAIQKQLDRRKPGQSALTTPRKESDEFEIISGVFEGKSTGAPITIIIPNQDSKPGDYAALKDIFRPSHADMTYHAKYGIRDYRGGGRSSARITAGWVAAGALAENWLEAQIPGLEIVAWVDSVYQIQSQINEAMVRREIVDVNSVRCPDPEAAAHMEAEIVKAREEGDSLGGHIRLLVRNCPAGLGEPVFGKLHALLGAAWLGINAVKGVEFGDGSDITRFKGSEINDAMQNDGDRLHILSNHSGGIQGGISNGADIRARIAFKPTATIRKSQQTVNTKGESITLEASGRHDPCVLPRAVPIVEALTALVLADLYMEQKLQG